MRQDQNFKGFPVHMYVHVRTRQVGQNSVQTKGCTPARAVLVCTPWRVPELGENQQCSSCVHAFVANPPAR